MKVYARSESLAHFPYNGAAVGVYEWRELLRKWALERPLISFSWTNLSSLDTERYLLVFARPNVDGAFARLQYANTHPWTVVPEEEALVHLVEARLNGDNWA